jgi:hypothetical protein
LDNWVADPTIRVFHRRQSMVSADELWHAAQEVRLRDTALLGRLVRWRIPDTPRDIGFNELFQSPPFLVLEEGPHSLVCGLVGRIWTLRRDYPQLSDVEEYLGWSKGGTARVMIASWAEPLDEGGSALCSEARVEAIGRQARLGLATIRPLVRGFQHLVGSDGITAAVRRAEGRPTPAQESAQA